MTDWILNSSPIIVFSRLGLISLLTKFPNELIIPQAVQEEIMEGNNDDPARIWFEQEGFNFVQHSTQILPVIQSWDLGKGETEVLNFGYQFSDFEIVVDDKAARKCAKTLGIKYVGSIGIILRAKKLNLISQVKPILSELPKHGFRINQTIIDQALRIAGEK